MVDGSARALQGRATHPGPRRRSARLEAAADDILTEIAASPIESPEALALATMIMARQYGPARQLDGSGEVLLMKLCIATMEAAIVDDAPPQS